MEILAGRSSELTSSLMRQIGRYRHKVFVEKLGWPLQCEHDMELDRFDCADTVYVVGLGLDKEVIGSARLLPTTQAYLLEQQFPQLLHGMPAPRSPQVWELSRFASVNFTQLEAATLEQYNAPVCIPLLRACLSVAAKRGAQQLISVSPTGIERLLRRAGIAVRRAGPPLIIDGYPLFAALLDCNQTHDA